MRWAHQAIDPAVLVQAARVVRAGGLVAFPTETFYGLAVDPFQSAALARLFAAKNRPADKPILTLVESIDQVSRLARAVPSLYPPLMEAFWPGPLTLVFPARPELPEGLTAGTGTVGVRVSAHGLAAALVQAVGAPITATSANLSGAPAPRTASEVRAQLGRRVDLLLDGGATPGGLGSTVVREEDGRLVLVRGGAVPFARLDQWIKTVRTER